MLAVLHVCALCVSHVGVCGVCVREGGPGPPGPPPGSAPDIINFVVQHLNAISVIVKKKLKRRVNRMDAICRCGW